MISEKICTQLLKTLNYSNNVKLISFDLKPLSEDVQGFMGEHYKLIINYNSEGIEKSHRFFVKNKPVKNKNQGDITESLGFYKREIFFYNNLFKQFEEYGFDISFAPKCYYCIPGESLIMEDISINGYILADKTTNLSLQQLKCTLKSVALLHAAGFAFERTKSKQQNQQFIIGEEYADSMFEAFFNQHINPDAMSNKWWTSTIRTLNVLLDLLPEDETFKQEFKTLLRNYDFGKVFVTESKYKKTLGHGDLWANNLMFKYENNIPVDCRLVDFQICRYFYPSFDVLLAIHLNSVAEFRDLHKQELFTYYYRTLTDILKKYGFEVNDFCSLDDFYRSMDLVMVEVLLNVLMIKIIISLPKEKLNDAWKEDDEGIPEVMFNNTPVAMAAFKTDDNYRRIITDVIYDFRKALRKNAEL